MKKIHIYILSLSLFVILIFIVLTIYSQQTLQLPNRIYPVCGNGICEKKESSVSCLIDCPVDSTNTNMDNNSNTNTIFHTTPPSPPVLPSTGNGGNNINCVNIGENKIPIIDMTANQCYHGEEGGLYGNGLDTPPEIHKQAALSELAKIQPLDANGNFSSSGKIGFMSIGMSNTNINFGAFQKQAQNYSSLNNNLIITNTAHFAFEAEKWATTEEPWTNAKLVIAKDGLTAKQIQVAWMYIALGRPEGDFNSSASKLEEYSKTIMQRLKKEYPNIKIVYISSRTYAGWATIKKNPEPYAYESGFAMRWMILEQINGVSELNYNETNGIVKAPLLLWGPYLWADGETPNSQGLFYVRTDFTETDGTHPSDQGAQKIGNFMLDWFKTNELAKGWFVE